MVAWRRIDDIPSGREVPWLCGVAANVVRNRARSERRAEGLVARLSRLEPSAAPDPELEVLFNTAPHVVSRTLRHQRISQSPMETRGVVVAKSGDELTVYISCQSPPIVARLLAMAFDLPQTSIRAIAKVLAYDWSGERSAQVLKGLGFGDSDAIQAFKRRVIEDISKEAFTLYGRDPAWVEYAVLRHVTVKSDTPWSNRGRDTGILSPAPAWGAGAPT